MDRFARYKFSRTLAKVFSDYFSYRLLVQTRSQSLLICSLKAMKDWGRNDVKVAGQAGKGEPIFVRSSL